MQLFDILRTICPGLAPEQCKLHLATTNPEGEDPLHIFGQGNFNAWQGWQTQRNFDRDHVVALINLGHPTRWLFAGVYNSLASTPTVHPDNGRTYHLYPLVERQEFAELRGRLVATFARPSRQSYLNAERWADQISLEQIAREPIDILPFPNYRNVHLSFDNLKRIAAAQPDSWRAPLSSVAGIYLITDNLAGQQYVGIACGAGGLWQRWMTYAATGHGGNKMLRDLLKGNPDYPSNFSYAILEVADPNALERDLFPRESHWKRVLGTRAHGLNGN